MSTKSGRSSFLFKALKSPSTAATLVEAEPGEVQALKRLLKHSLGIGEGPIDTGGTGAGKKVRVVYVTEQVHISSSSHLHVLHHMPSKVLRTLQN